MLFPTQEFINGIQMLGVWPFETSKKKTADSSASQLHFPFLRPELTANDRKEVGPSSEGIDKQEALKFETSKLEVFAALLVPSQRVVRLLQEGAK